MLVIPYSVISCVLYYMFDGMLGMSVVLCSSPLKVVFCFYSESVKSMMLKWVQNSPKFIRFHHLHHLSKQLE